MPGPNLMFEFGDLPQFIQTVPTRPIRRELALSRTTRGRLRHRREATHRRVRADPAPLHPPGKVGCCSWAARRGDRREPSCRQSGHEVQQPPGVRGGLVEPACVLREVVLLTVRTPSSAECRRFLAFRNDLQSRNLRRDMITWAGLYSGRPKSRTPLFPQGPPAIVPGDGGPIATASAAMMCVRVRPVTNRA
jgi:hypothetical protein